MACIWFMCIYSFLILWLECGLCGFLNFSNMLCELFVAFGDLYKFLFLKSTCNMVLMWFHVNSVSIDTLRSQSSHQISELEEGMSRFFCRRTPYRLSSMGLHLFQWIKCICLVTCYTTSYWHKYILWIIKLYKTAKLIMSQLSENL